MTVKPLPDKNIPFKERLEMKRKRSMQLIKAKDAERWNEHKFKTNEPIGIVWFGDPHIDDDGCNMDLLIRDLDIVNATDGLLAANIGDSLNAWSGRLKVLYANQHVTEDEALEYFKWFMEYVPWWLNIYGNHCDWPTPNKAAMRVFAEKASLATADWQAQIKLAFPNGREVKIHAAHDFPGNSQWNSLHGNMKKAKMSQQADIYISGHKHNWAIHQVEDQDTNRVTWAMRARGYKSVDSYAEHLGFGSQQFGASVVSVINPQVDGPSMIHCFADIVEAAGFLKYLRKKYASKRS
jgi:UDP-2,3-diacylglucosamine pyrophosphatase LpxH